MVPRQSDRAASALRCPACGAVGSLVPILYGLPMLTPELDAKIERGELVLGGCIIEDDQPSHLCRACERQVTPTR